MSRPTLIRQPPVDSSKSPIENVLDLIPLSDIGPDIFTNTREHWHPPGARGIFGGAVIAQCLSAAQLTIPSPSFLIHSMHCYFVLAGDASIPILYHVERVRDGKSFVTRTVQARQKGRCIFTTTCSFVREGSGGEMTVEHESAMPKDMRQRLEGMEKLDDAEEEDGEGNGVQSQGPFISLRLGVANSESSHPHLKKAHTWTRARGKITPSAGPQAHLSALAYVSDSYFIGTISRVHNLWRFGRPPPDPQSSSQTPQHNIEAIEKGLKFQSRSSQRDQWAAMETAENSASPNKETRKVGMMVSLDHTIYFHRPKEVKADEWMCTEMDSPWSGEGRGLVSQRIWNKEGKLLATCVQEGLVRLVQDEKPRETKL